MILTGLLVLIQIITLAALVYMYRLLRQERLTQEEQTLEQMLAASVEELLQELQNSSEKAARELARQKKTLETLLREADRRIQAWPDAEQTPAETGEIRATGWREEALRLASQGLSEQAIARQTRVGLEEVRLLLATALPEGA